MATENLADSTKFRQLLKDADDAVVEQQLIDSNKEADIEIVIEYNVELG